jgi:hypothetical protein
MGWGKLDISEYLSKADDGRIYPSEAQMTMLNPYLPKQVYRPAPSISDREFWTRISKKESAKKIFEEAVAGLDKKPEVPISDEIYRRANKEENRGKIVGADFTENLDRVVLDIRDAYEFQPLETLFRTLENDKSGSGTITITDEFTASKPIEFGTAIMTYGPYTVVDANTVLLERDGRKIKVEISAEGGSFVMKDEQVPVNFRLKSGLYC